MFIATVLLLNIWVMREALTDTRVTESPCLFHGDTLLWCLPSSDGLKAVGVTALTNTCLQTGQSWQPGWSSSGVSECLRTDPLEDNGTTCSYPPLFQKPLAITFHLSSSILFYAWRCNKYFSSRHFQSPESSLLQLTRFPPQMWIVLFVQHCDVHEVIKIHYDTVSQRPASAASYTACRWPCRLRWEGTRHHRTAASYTHTQNPYLSLLH